MWALQTNDAFTQLYSGGRDKNIWWTELRNPDNRALVCTETAPVLKMILTPDQGGLWTSTSESNVKFWNVGRMDGPVSGTSPQLQNPDYVIHGGSSIKQYHVLNDKRHILTKDTDSNVALYDVLKAQKVEEMGKIDFDKEVKGRLDVSNDELILKFMP